MYKLLFFFSLCAQVNTQKLVLNNENSPIEEIFYVKSNDKFIKHGEYTLYSEDGELLYVLTFNQGVPLNLDIRTEDTTNLLILGDLKDGNGKLITYFANETQNQVSEKKKISEKIPSIEINYVNGVPHGHILKYRWDGSIALKGNYEKGYMVGEWIFYDSEGNADSTKVYSLSDSIKDENNKIIPTNIVNERGYIIVEEMPMVLGSKAENGFRDHIRNNLLYPKTAAINGISGKVLAQFVVNEIGQVEDITILRGVYPVLDQEVIRVISISPYWTPGFQQGMPVKVQYVFPITFVLQK